MRDAKFADVLRRLSNPERRILKIRRVQFEGLVGFADGSVEPASSLVAICGGTGSGKSAFLEAISYSLDPASHDDHASLERLKGAKINLAIDTPSGSYTCATDLPLNERVEVGDSPPVSILRLEDRVSAEARFSSGIELVVLLDGVDEQQFDRLQLEMTSHICGKAYKSISIYEVEVEAGLIVPFFQIELPDVSYDSRTMATGELSICYLVWKAFTAPALSVLLVEEPEAFLPPSKHQWVYRMLVVACDARSLAIVVTSHSAELIAEFEGTNIIPLKLEGGQTRIPIGGESKARTLNRLGLSPSRIAVFLVEDEIARSTLNEILAWGDFPISLKYEILDLKGAANIVSVLERLPSVPNKIDVVGVLDGDMQPTYSAHPQSARLSFLPFLPSVEEVYFALLDEAPRALLNTIARNKDAVATALGAHVGIDKHDRFRRLAEDLGYEPGELAKRTFAYWSTKNKKTLQTLKKRLTKQLALPL